MGWIYVFVAGLFEVGFTVSLKLSKNFTVLGPSVAFLMCAFLSFGLLTRAMKFIPLGTAYAVWTGIGALGTVAAGVLLFDEALSFARLSLLLLVVAAIVGLKFVSPGTPGTPGTPDTVTKTAP